MPMIWLRMIIQHKCLTPIKNDKRELSMDGQKGLVADTVSWD